MPSSSTNASGSERSELIRFLQSETAQLAYTFCEKLCLGFVNDAEELFKRVVRQARLAARKRETGIDKTIFKALHDEWQKFSAGNARLAATRTALTFDWNRADKRLAEDALMALDPQAREIFLYRFLLKFSDEDVTRLTEMPRDVAAKRFQNAVDKVDPA